MLDETLKNAHKKTIGVKQTQRALEKGLVKKVFVARDADGHVLKPIKELCRQLNVECVDAGSMAELGKICGIDVGAAVAALLAD